MKEEKSVDESAKYVNRVCSLMLALVATAGALLFIWRAWLAGAETWEYFIHLHPGILWDFIKWASWFLFLLWCCCLCLDSAIRNTIKYIAYIREVDLQAEAENPDEAAVEKAAGEAK